MADDVDLYATIYACPQAQARAVLEVLEGNGLCYEWHGRQVASDDPTIRLDEAYVVVGGYTVDLADELIAAAPGSAFKVHATPNSDGLAEAVLYTPELGRFRAACDNDGDLVFTAGQVREAGEKGFGAVLDLIGARWTEQLDAIAAAADDEVEVPPEALADLDADEREDLAHELHALLHGGPAAVRADLLSGAEGAPIPA